MKLEIIYPKVGDKYGKWTIIEVIKGGRIVVQCECGEIVTKRFYDLKTGTSKQCLKCRYGSVVAERKQKPKHWTKVENGMRFGHWTIVDVNDFKFLSSDKERSYRVKCDCGEESYVRITFLTNKRSTCCKDCRIGRGSRKIGCLNASVIRRAREGAEARNLEWSVSDEYLADLLEKQDMKCALSGIDLCVSNYGLGSKRGRLETTISLDRIDSFKGYVEGNVQWVHKSINIMKSTLTQEEFINFCKLVATKSCEGNNEMNQIQNKF